MVRVLLKLEGMAVLAAAVYLYGKVGFQWWMFVLLLFAADLSMLGYLVNKKTGAVLYNLFHTYLFPIILAIIAFLIDNMAVLSISLIWCAHIGMDRLFGFGLKYPGDFNGFPKEVSHPQGMCRP